MSELIKKLKASPPDIIGDEASDIYDKAYYSVDKNASVFYHSAVHGYDETIKTIEIYIQSFAKVGPSETEFIYSYQPYKIGRFDVEDGEHCVSIWFMLYSNCIVSYYEMGEYRDVAIVMDIKDIQNMEETVNEQKSGS